jgi:hypothetical protein
MINLPLDDREKINLSKPIFTLDVNQIALKHPSQRPQGYEHLASIEYNYFETDLVEIAVTPETESEITKGVPDGELGWNAYKRVSKSRWFKTRPVGSTLLLTEQSSNELWLDMRYKLCPTVSDDQLTPQQRADVSQLFFHTVSSGATASNSVFVTWDKNFLNKDNILYTCYGVQIMPPTEAWNQYESDYNLITPTTGEVDRVFNQQENLFTQIRADMR